MLALPAAGWVLVCYYPWRIERLVGETRDVYVGYVTHAPLYLALLFGTLLAERLRPVLPTANAWRGMREDLCWVIAKPLFDAAIAATGIILALWVHARLLGGVTLQLVANWPRPALIAIAFVAVDFLLYVTHVIRHRVPLFWRFHSVHHAQTRLNFFTEDRNHPIDVLLTRMPIVVVMAILGIPRQLGFVVGMLSWWHGRFIHANLRARLGPLRVILVTPQSHRIHHSCDPAHRDKNFGTHLAVWDRLFGTQHPDDEVYPPTGVAGLPSPREGSNVAALTRELVRPFTTSAALR